MNKEDYFKYYIQGSDHYLISKDVFNELFDEMSNWREEVKELKEKYLNAVADYETTMFEKEQLNSLVNSCQEEIRELKKQLQERPKEYVFIGNAQNKTRDFINQITKDNKELKNQLEDTNEELELVRCDLHNRTSERNGYYRNIEILENQQKEFIEYMNKTIEELECDDVDDEEMKGYLIQRIDTFKEILSKYKEIIGSDINVGSKGDKE